jgi:hypothetical protein
MPVGTVELITQSEYARRRGCTEGAVRRAVRDGRISLIEGRIDPVAADAQWARNTRVRAGSRATDDANLQAGSPAPRRGRSDDDDEDDGYWASKARREKAEADLAELKLAEQRAELVRAADVRAAQARRLAALRESLLQLPARLAPVLAAEADAARCHETLQAELHAVLEQMTEGVA